MTRIEDIGAFNAVREAGLAKLLPAAPRIAVGMGTCGRGNGAEAVHHALGQRHRARRHGRAAGLHRLLRGVLAGSAGQRVDSRPAAGDAAARAGIGRGADPGGGQPGTGAAGPGLVPHRRMGPPDRAHPLRQRISGAAAVVRNSVLCRAEAHRAAQLRADRAGRYRRVHRGGRLPGLIQGADRRQAGAGDRADQGGQAARARRRRICHRAEVGISVEGRGQPEIHHLQRGRRRPRRVHEPQRDRKRPARAARRHDHRRLRDRRRRRHHLRARRVSAGGAPAGNARSSRRGNTACWASTFWGGRFNFDIELVEGAGAFVCGEETALIASLEGVAGTAAAAPAVSGAEGARAASPPTSTTWRRGTTWRPSC